jgi:hypothetical protein
VVAPFAAVVAPPAAVVAEPFEVDGVLLSLFELLPHDVPAIARDTTATALTESAFIDRFIGVSIQGSIVGSR